MAYAVNIAAVLVAFVVFGLLKQKYGTKKATIIWLAISIPLAIVTYLLKRSL